VMKKNTQITTKVLDVGEDTMTIRTDVTVTREKGLRSSHMEVRSVRHFGDWQLASKAVHDRLTGSVKQWIDTGIADEDLADYELE
jgi:hypothetical protein